MSKKHSFACVALLCVLALQNAQAGSGGTGGSGDDFPPYEVGDIVIFGPVGESVEKIGHSAILGPRSEDGTGAVTLRDCMPIPGITENNKLNHGNVEGIITVSTLADGTWSQEKEEKRWNIWAAAGTYIGKQYITYDPPNTSDFSWSWWSEMATEQNSNLAVQADSIYATPAGTHDYKPRQKGSEVSRYTCCGFTETVYEGTGNNLCPNASEFVESPYKAPFLWIFSITVAKGYVFWPVRQLEAGAKSVPKGPDVTIETPANDEWVNSNPLTIKGKAVDVSKLRQNKVVFIHVKPDGTNEEISFDVDQGTHLFNQQVTWTDGIHILKVHTYDQAGNLSEKFKDGTIEYKIKIDTKKPTGSISVSISPS